MARYVRTRGGLVIHLGTCRHATAKSAYPWNWAESFEPQEVAYHLKIRALAYRWCRLCFPAGEPDWRSVA